MSRAPSFDRIVVTGGTGFIGRHLLEALLSSGYSPVSIVRKLDQVERLPDFLKSKIRWIEVDLLDSDAVSHFIEMERPSVLFHLAGTKGVDNDYQASATACEDLNVGATRHLLDISTHAGVSRVIITGSAEEFGNQTGPFDETFPLNPTSIYGKSKAEATRLALRLHDDIDCPVVILRLFTVYGPSQPSGMFVSDAVRSAVKNEPFSMSEGSQQRDLLFVTDVIAAMTTAASAPGIEGKVFNLGSGRPIPLVDLAQLIWKLSNTSALLKVGIRSRKDDDMQVTWADSSLAKEFLNWSPQVDLESGLRATIDWARREYGVR